MEDSSIIKSKVTVGADLVKWLGAWKVVEAAPDTPATLPSGQWDSIQSGHVRARKRTSVISLWN